MFKKPKAVDLPLPTPRRKREVRQVIPCNAVRNLEPGVPHQSCVKCWVSYNSSHLIRCPLPDSGYTDQHPPALRTFTDSRAFGLAILRDSTRNKNYET